MSEEPVSIVSHISIGTNQFEQAITFYDTVLATLNCRRIMEHGEARILWSKVSRILGADADRWTAGHPREWHALWIYRHFQRAGTKFL